MAHTALILALVAVQLADAPKDASVLEGRWVVTGYRQPDGSGAREVADQTLVIKGNKAEWTDLGMFGGDSGTVSIDTKSSPSRIELKTKRGTFRGIFTLTGSGLTMVLYPAGQGYPKGFDPDDNKAAAALHLEKRSK
jgi:uncharacterized protein (TIGR03067 family)